MPSARIVTFFYFSFAGLHRYIHRILLPFTSGTFNDDACDIRDYLVKPRMSAAREETENSREAECEGTLWETITDHQVIPPLGDRRRRRPDPGPRRRRHRPWTYCNCSPRSPSWPSKWLALSTDCRSRRRRSMISIPPRICNYAQRIFTHIFTTVYNQVLIYTAEWTGASWREQKCPNFETVARGDSNLRLPWLWVRRSTAELRRTPGKVHLPKSFYSDSVTSVISYTAQFICFKGIPNC